jgi:hypothetical protein
MRSLLLFVILSIGISYSAQADELEMAPCEMKMTCLQKEGFLNALYTVQASFGMVNAVCLIAPEPIVTKSIVAINAGLGVANVILRNMPCTEDGDLSEDQRQQVLEEVCRLTDGVYDPFMDKCIK